VLRLVDSAAALFLLLSEICCHGRGPSTRSMVYNLSMSAFEVEGQQVEVGFSQSVNTAHGVTDTVELKRGAVAARLVITSLVAAGDPNQYDAAIGWPWTDTSRVYQILAYARDYADNDTFAVVTIFVRR
jgi:hypothetical protein